MKSWVSKSALTLLVSFVASVGASACDRPATKPNTPAPPTVGQAEAVSPPPTSPFTVKPPSTAKLPAEVATAAPRVIFATAGGEVAVDVEVRRTPSGLQQGLMYRRHLPDGDGMIFIMPSQRIQSFWMKNTYIPLDMIFVNELRVVAGIVRETTPLTLSPRMVNAPSRFVIEVAGGFAARSGIATGDTVAIENIPDLP
ncbi:MAG: uncharacterized membrane protein (UPF0127 family) [Myxococcota bacterium]